MTHGRADGARTLPTWLVAAAVLVLAAAAGTGVAKLRADADVARREQLALERIRSLVNEQSSLEWQAVAARGRAAELARAVRSRDVAIHAELTRLAALGRAADPPLRAALERYEGALQRELALLVSGRYDAALTLGESRVDPSLERLLAVLASTLEDSSARARDAGVRATAATAFSLALAGILVALLYAAFRRTRRSLATADERALRHSERWFRSLVQNATELIAVVDADTRLAYVTESAVPLIGYEPRELLGRRLAELAHPEDAAALETAAAGQRAARFEARVSSRDGSWVFLEWASGGRADAPGCILTGRDVTERKRLEHELRHMAFHDSLTGLANRALFEDRLAHALKAAARRRGGLAVLFVDVDDFKTVNDSLGHGAGDVLLRAVGERVKTSLRASDTPARLGGDEFAVLLEDVADAHGALQTAERLLAALEPPFEVAGRQLAITASIGIAPAWSGDETMHDLMRNADLAMYEAKRQGGGRCRLFEEAMHAVVLTRLELAGELQEAVEQEQFELHFQPIVSLDSSAVLGAEALVRWRHPERGLLPPGEFLPLAEESGLIVPLGRWVLEDACRTLRGWQEEIPGLPVYLTVNVSMRQLHEPAIVDHVREALAGSDLAPDRLVLEITESFLADETEAPRLRLQRIRALGVRLAVDDFGTGYSALGYLQRFPIDMLKIDRSFVAHARPGSPSRNLVRSIVQLGRSLHLEPVAEGVEDAEQAAELRAMGVRVGQGFHFARPLPPDDFAALLAGPTHTRAALLRA